MSEPVPRRGWMVCNIRSEPCSPLFATEEEAQSVCDGYPVGGDYHVRPVTVAITVRGQAPRPWCFRADGNAL